MSAGEPEGQPMTLQQAADRLGVHYMTAYRYVKLGLLYAEKHRGAWRVTEDDLSRFLDSGESPTTPTDSEADDLASFESAVLEGDEPGAWDVLQRWTSGADEPTDLHVDLIAKTMASIGRRWAEGHLTIAQEHQASEVVARLLARYGPSVTARGRRRGRVVVGGAPGDPHRLPSALFSDLIRAHGVEVTDLGANVPAETFLEAARRAEGNLVVCISVTGPDHEAGVRSAVAAVRSEYPELTIAIGGGAVTSKEQARSLGADLWHDDPRLGADLVAAAAQGSA